jgi:hypothetical protein
MIGNAPAADPISKNMMSNNKTQQSVFALMRKMLKDIDRY